MTLELAGDWLIDESCIGELVLIRVARRREKAVTRFQTAEVVETEAFGTCLVLDGALQSASVDEFIYHESLVHPAMLASPNPEHIAILGGGEGATLREVVRHRTVREATMVDIDREVVAFCREHMPTMHADAFDHPRARLKFDDARGWIERQPEGSLDVVISDISDPVAGGPACLLFTREFFGLVRRALRPDGVLALQASQASLLEHEMFVRIVKSLQRLFDRVEPLTVYVDSFSDQWGLLVASRGVAGLPPATEVDRLLAERVEGRLRHYDGETQVHMKALPRYLRDALGRPAEPYTDANPPGIEFKHA